MQMKYLTKYLFSFTLGMLASTYTFAQTTQQIIDTDINKNSAAPFYKWEVGIDALPLIDKAKDAFGYIVKRNYQTSSGRKALRLKLLPQISTSPGTSGTARTNNSSINIAIGYEFQKMFGHFSAIYGFEPFYQHSLVKVTVIPSGVISFKQTDSKIGISGFIGGRYYINNHIALTLETHLVYQYRTTKSEDVSTFYSFGNYNQILINPVHALYISYHF